MSETKWTPGPWAIAGYDQNGQLVVRAEIEVCTCWHHCVGSIEKQMEANALLIAASPDLYEACSQAARVLESLPNEGSVYNVLDRAMRKARAES